MRESMVASSCSMAATRSSSCLSLMGFRRLMGALGGVAIVDGPDDGVARISEARCGAPGIVAVPLPRVDGEAVEPGAPGPGGFRLVAREMVFFSGPPDLR